MTNLVTRLLARFPSVRRLLQENAQLHDRIQHLELELSKTRSEIVAATQRTWVPPGHFYSPVVNPADDLVQRAMRLEAAPDVAPEALGISEAEMMRWFHIISLQYENHPFPEQKQSDGLYYYANPNFPLADALALAAVMVEKRPRRFTEIGSGFSTCAAIDISEKQLGGSVEMRFIDPHPELALSLIPHDSPYRDRFLRSRLQEVSLTVFEELRRGDILFIDSSHVGKTGSDVLDYLFRILPSLAPGVMVHIHDIFYPFEYPAMWIVEENRSWNEAYFLRAFLQANDRFRLLFLCDWFYKCRKELVAAAMPLWIPHRGGSLWMESR
jgi:hypothetical protein